MEESIAEGKPFYVHFRTRQFTFLLGFNKKKPMNILRTKEPGERHTNPEFGANCWKIWKPVVGMISGFC